jgi:hypothetical protein
MFVLLNQGGCPVARPARLWDRLLARMRTCRLDGDLAGGASPDATVALALRAQLLVRTRTRRHVAESARRVLAAAIQAPATDSSPAPATDPSPAPATDPSPAPAPGRAHSSPADRPGTPGRTQASRADRSLARAARGPQLPVARRPRVPICRDRVRESAEDFGDLIRRLLADGPVAARGVALASILLSDGSGPLYQRGNTDDVRARVREAVNALDPLTAPAL